MSKACTPKTGGGFSAGCFALLASTCVKRCLRVTRDDSTRRTSASRKLLSVIWRSAFGAIAHYVCGSSHMTCTRSILSGISISMANGFPKINRTKAGVTLQIFQICGHCYFQTHLLEYYLVNYILRSLYIGFVEYHRPAPLISSVSRLIFVFHSFNRFMVLRSSI